jgi:hypothetical protein
VGSPAGKYLVFLIQIQLSEAPRELVQLRDIYGELQVSWGGEQGEARGGMLQGVLEESGSAIDLQFGIRSACGGYFLEGVITIFRRFYHFRRAHAQRRPLLRV